MKRTLVVDGNNMVARFTHSYGRLKTSEGIESGGVYGVLMFLRTFLEKTEYQYKRIVFVFDSQSPEFRLLLYPEYKANRTSRKLAYEEGAIYERDFYGILQDQLKYVKRILKKIGVVTVILPGYEADDCIYKVIRAIKDENKKEKFVIYSADNDFRQLISKRTVLARPVGKGDVEYITKKPKHFLVSRSMIGDSSDNIKGVPLIGEKRAAQIVEEVGESKIKRFLKNISKCEQYAEKLKEYKKVILRNYLLTSLLHGYKKHTHDVEGYYVPPTFSVKNLRNVWGEFEIKSFHGEALVFQEFLGDLETDLPESQFTPVSRLPKPRLK